MGKVRKPRPTKIKKNVPMDDSDQEEQVPVDSKENAIQTVIDQLQAVNVEEKYCGLQTFALLIESPENIEPVISRGLVKMVAPLLLDAASSVRNASAGALRNLSTRQEACEAMMDQDVMSSLVMFFHEHTETWVPEANSKTKNEDMDTVVQCINLLLNLCESSELAIKYLGQSRILDLLPRYLDKSVFGDDITIAVMQCLFVVVEDNPPAMEKVKSNCEKQLEGLLALEGSDPSELLIKTLASGIIINCCNGDIAALQVNIINQIISTLSKTLSIDHRNICNEASSSVPLANNAGKVVAPKGKAAQELEKLLKSITQTVDAQQSAVEIIANICSCSDADDSENGESSDSEEMADDDICNNATEATSFAEDKLSPQVLEALIALEIFDKVWAKTQLPAENVMMILKEYDGSQLVYKKLFNLQSAALLCINNMLSTLPIENLGGVNGVYKIWVDAGKLVFKQNTNNTNLLESATAVMRAALDKIKFRENGNTSQQNLFDEISLSDIQIMLTGIKECQVPEIRSNLIRMIGILALLLVNNLNDTTSNVICTITESILEQAHKENEVWVLAEAIDTIVDLYSEDETDILAAKVKLPEKLAILAPVLKNKARQQRRLPKEYKVLVSTATSNLPRFIKYKKSRICKLSVSYVVV